MTVRVKICGINDSGAFDAVVASGADWVGFVFFPPSPRVVTPDQAAALSGRHSGGPARVGLFVEPTDADVAAVLSALPLDVLQIYATSERVMQLRARFGVPIWHAIGIATPADLPRSRGGEDALLLEAKPPANAANPGGNAVGFDWSVLRGWPAPSPWVLAGGLTTATVAAAVGATGATAVDVSSGVERARGAKDPALIAAFIAAARGGGEADPATRRSAAPAS